MTLPGRDPPGVLSNILGKHSRRINFSEASGPNISAHFPIMRDHNDGRNMSARGSATSMGSSASSSSDRSSSTYAAMLEEELLVKTDGFPRSATRRAECRRRRRLVIAVVSLVLSVISLLSVSAIVAFVLLGDMHLAQVLGVSPLTSGETSDQVCLPCAQVTSDPLSDSRSPLVDMLDVSKDEDNDTDICCARTNAQFAALFRLVIQRQQSIQKFAGLVVEPSGEPSSMKRNDSSAVSAHLTFKPGSGNNEVQQWRGPKDSSLAHVQPGLTFHDNTLYVITPGLYYVYCHITYDNFVSSSQVASSYVYRDSLVLPQTSGIVLKTRHTGSSQQTDRHSTYVGGVFALYKGDKLYVKVSEPSVVSRDEKGSFFGIFRVGN